MAQHFLLSAKARTLSLKAIYQGGEEKAYDTFRKLRWAKTDGDAVCPRCGSCEAYDIATRRKFKCKACHHQFSVTSGTIFASRKMAFTDLLGAICIFVNAAKGLSALQFSRDMDVQYKTAFVLAHKLRDLKGQDLEEGVSTRLLVYCASLIRDGLSFDQAIRATMIEPLSDDADVKQGLQDIVTAVIG